MHFPSPWPLRRTSLLLLLFLHTCGLRILKFLSIMPNILKDVLKCKHPNSRKTKALAKKTKKINNREKVKLGFAARANVMGEKFGWFAEALEEVDEPLTPTQFLDLFDKYLHRFDEEIEQIKLKQSISKGRQHQHFSRESAIRMTLEKETNDYNGGGIQFVDLCDQLQFLSFKQWDGNAMSLQHLKLQLISKRNLLEKNKME